VFKNNTYIYTVKIPHLLMIFKQKAMKENNNGDSKKTKYLDSELEEFKQIIFAKLKKANQDFELLTEAYSNNSEHGTNDTSPTFKVLEEGQQVLSKEENSRLAARQQRFITNLENALIRIENKTYGICRVTGKLISKERLKAVPHATLSIDAKNQMAKPNPIN
jgi:RNA polymerase-binding transcription factor DksA|tara:strand:- start:574 stop:1062 length:489 start_codon:yes stop_codon:yes gene_type:complete